MLRGRQSESWENSPPLVKFDYTFNSPFANICSAYLKKYNFERKFELTTIADVEQVDDDTLVYYRRNEKITAPRDGFEKVTINRADKTMVVEALFENTDHSIGVTNRHVFQADGENTIDKWDVYAATSKEWTINQFTAQISQIMKTMKFDKWAQEE